MSKGAAGRLFQTNCFLFDSLRDSFFHGMIRLFWRGQIYDYFIPGFVAPLLKQRYPNPAHHLTLCGYLNPAAISLGLLWIRKHASRLPELALIMICSPENFDFQSVCLRPPIF